MWLVPTFIVDWERACVFALTVAEANTMISLFPKWNGETVKIIHLQRSENNTNKQINQQSRRKDGISKTRLTMCKSMKSTDWLRKDFSLSYEAVLQQK